MTYLFYLGFPRWRRNDIALALIALILLQAVVSWCLGLRTRFDGVAIDLAAMLAVHFASHLEALRRSIREPGEPARRDRRRPGTFASRPIGRPIRAWVAE
jgi:hypothetical protein